jgi:hypothetical protein
MAQLNADVPDELRKRARRYCLDHNVLVQDLIRVLLQRALDEVDSGHPSKFVRDVLERVAPKEKPEGSKKVVPLRRKSGGRESRR